jgi:hypothetical protein
MFPRSDSHHSRGSGGHHSSGGSGGHPFILCFLDLTAIIPEVLAAITLVAVQAATIYFYVPLDLTANIPEVLAAITLVAVQAATIHFMFPRSDSHHSGGSGGHHSIGGSGGHHSFYVS